MIDRQRRFELSILTRLKPALLRELSGPNMNLNTRSIHAKLPKTVWERNQKRSSGPSLEELRTGELDREDETGEGESGGSYYPGNKLCVYVGTPGVVTIVAPSSN